MKLITFIILLLAIQLVSAQALKDLMWLEGNWKKENVRPGRTAYESWKWNRTIGLTGIGTTLSGADTVFVERLRIVEKEGSIFYVAEVAHNATPTYFKITSADESGFTCENPDHDFPKKIIYKVEGKKMVATISGDGKEVPFVYKRVE